MKEMFSKLINKIKDWIENLIYTDIVCIGDSDDSNMYKNNTIKNKKKVIQPIDRKYISRENAIDIADMEDNLRYHMYLDSKKNDSPYGIIEISDYYSTLVKYNGKYAWYIKVLEGRYGTKDGDKYLRGYFDEYSNISCLVLADSGKFIYLGKDFDTRLIRMVTDEEFLLYINNVKHM